MSEEVLKALMQLFAIIANQDGGSGDVHDFYVRSFLKSQISEDRIKEFSEYYRSFIKTSAEKEDPNKRTSVKDSVKTLGICKKINKTLNQKQKIIVFARLHEFILQEENSSGSRSELLRTVADVFNISKEEYRLIDLIFTGSYEEFNNNFLVVNDRTAEGISCRQITIGGFNGVCIFHYVSDTNLTFFIYRGNGEMVLNGLVVQPGHINVLSPGSTIRHSRGTILYSDVINNFLGESFENNISFDAAVKWHLHPNGKVALHELEIHETSGTFFGIMGASGSGKTTLLNVLSGIDHVTDGTIAVNGKNIHTEPGEISGVLGFIPQDDLLIEELTVYQNLFLSARLCFKNINEKELNIKVLKLLTALGLQEAKDIRVGNPMNKKISGGQRKRLNIALELIREPQILFVDEPTSGLSSRDSENVMDLLKELTHKGKLIFVVIHQPSSDIYKLFDKIFLLDTGGYPVYYGNPVEALLYFKKATNQVNDNVAACHSCGSVNPELIFNLIEAKEIDEYGNYTEKRKIDPEGWYQLFRRNFSNSAKAAEKIYSKLTRLEIPGKFRQWRIFFTRDFLAKISNRQYLLISLLEVPLLAFFLALLIRYINRSNGESSYSYYNNENIPAFFFMAIIVALLVGLTISAEEIYKDQKILKRERFLHLSRFSYLLSKVFILFSISALQSVFLCLIGIFLLEVPGNILPFYLVIFSIFCSANLMGLVLSSTFNSPVTIYIIIPLVIIPQMLLGGAMFKFSRLNEYIGGSPDKVPMISNFMVSRWAYEGIAVETYRSNKYEKDLYSLKKLESGLNYRVAYLIPKIEEFADKLKKNDSVLSKPGKQFLETMIRNTARDEFQLAQEMYGKIDIADTLDSLSAYKKFIVEKYNFVLDKEEEETQLLDKRGIKKKLFSNKNLEELMTNALEKNKILVDSSKLHFVQVTDPVYLDPPKTKDLGWTAHFYSPVKYFFGKRMTTLSYNMLMIWLLNLLTFLLLYSDLLKKMMNIFPAIKTKKQQSQ